MRPRSALIPRSFRRRGLQTAAVLVAVLLGACSASTSSAPPSSASSRGSAPPPSNAPSDSVDSGATGGADGATASGAPAASPAATGAGGTNPDGIGPSGWVRVNQIAQPPGFEKILINGNGKMQTTCAPCHPPIDTVMNDVTDGPAGLVAVGYIIQDLPGAIWHAADGANWSLVSGFPTTSLFQSVAANDHRYVAFGRDGNGVAAWTSTDGDVWHRSPSGDAFAGTPMRPASIAGWNGGFVAAGFAGTEFFSATAAFWVSKDGLAWRRAPDAPDLADARPTAIAVGGPGLVAVGIGGPADHPGSAVIWTSTDGLRWSRVPDSAVFHDARLRSVGAVPGIGMVAVGENLAGNMGVVLTSPDGLHWERTPPSAELGRADIQVRMFDVASGRDGIVVVGTETIGMQYGDAFVWTSPDGRTWAHTGMERAFLDGELNAVTRWGSRLVAVGDRGAPDTYVSQVWMSPEGWAR